MNFIDDNMVMLSALQHYLFCPRQCALIHIEDKWAENYLTSSGKVLHERVDEIAAETRRNVHICTSLRLHSKKYMLVGVADLVEFHRSFSESDIYEHLCVRLPKLDGFWIPYPVDYKRGSPKDHNADRVQLCAQALCLEEQLNVTILSGALFYGKNRHREIVNFNDDLRKLTIETINSTKTLLDSGETPPPVIKEACQSCSLLNECQSFVINKNKSVKDWIYINF